LHIANVYNADTNKLKDFIELVKEEHNVDLTKGFTTGHS
jgi:hypothetical protein